ncbi:MAG: hypothetical protein FD166_128 [Bacteroidetes bacterium]|nr:MAG: hypothetical protein FD166_128 [Bacteroidota bacterium]
MIKKCLLAGIVLLMVTQTRAQIKHPESLTRLVNSTLLYQVLNDFDRTIPLVLFAPGYFYVGNLTYSKNPLFNESIYYENDELIKTSSYYQKEIFDVVDAGFINYIPADSIMQARVIEGNQLLFELKFMRKGDTLIFMQTDAERSRNKTVGFAMGKVISVSYSDTEREINYFSTLQGDTLRISGMIDGKTGKNTRSTMHYKNGFLTEASFFNLISGKEQLTSKDLYYMNEISKPALKQTLNRKGRVTDSTHYYYDGTNLVHYQSFSGNSERLSISFVYNRNGKLSVKTVKSPVRNYTSDYSYSNGLISDLEIDDKMKSFRRHFVFTSDAGRKLAGIEYITIAKESMIENPETRWLFGYNEKGNINAIKVMDDRGLITREIRLEYVFYPGAR